MGKILQGILGGVSGKVGNVIGSSWKGIEYIRIMPSSVANPQTDPQLTQRQKLSVAVAFVKTISEFCRTSFRAQSIKMSGYNACLSYNMRNAITGTYPNEAIDYPNALVAEGTLPSALNAVASSTIAGTVKFDWDDNSDEVGAAATDETLLVIHNPSQHQSVTIDKLAVRADTTQTVTVPSSFSGDLVHCYIAFIRADGSINSNSSFAGAVTVA
jgi:hypothetical protein